MGFFDNMRKPQGKLGNFQLKSMNKEHTPLSLWGLTHLSIKPEDSNLSKVLILFMVFSIFIFSLNFNKCWVKISIVEIIDIMNKV